VLNNEQQLACDLISRGDNVFISGSGGTGKSFLIEHIKQLFGGIGHKFAVASSTGISAIPIGGVTIHSLLGTNILGTIPEVKSYVETEKAHKKFTKNLANIDTIIVDEVSMLSSNYIDMIDYYLKTLTHTHHPFGGYQMIFIGDFCQLPPVEKIREVRYAFESRAWEMANIKNVFLTKTYRQEDEEFVRHLNEIRFGNVTQETLDFFNPCVGNVLKDPTKLFSTNKTSSDYNMQQLSLLKSDEITVNASYSGNETYFETIKKNCTAENILTVKVGAPVILLSNNKIEGYANGSRGTILSYDNEKFVVKLLNGHEVNVEVNAWNHLSSELDSKGDYTVLATMTQYPMKLAYSITMHKSQGMSIDFLSLNLMDVFVEGQSYVALSRAKTIQGLHLQYKLNRRIVKTNERVRKFYEETKSEESVANITQR
jgi:ATP-dependent exoDNAse (exonuclease V) alpha subunit